MPRNPHRRDLRAAVIPNRKAPKTRRKTSPSRTALSRMVPSRTVQNLRAQSRRLPRKKTPPGKTVPLRREATSKSSETLTYLGCFKPILSTVKPNRVISLLQLTFKVILNHVKQMNPRLFAGNAVSLIGIDHQTKLLAGLDQRIDHLDAVLKMHIVIACSVHQHQS